MIKKILEKMKKISAKSYILFAIVLLVILTSVFADTMFPNSQFALIIENTIGKFFNVGSFFANSYVRILESITVIFFIWLLVKLLNAIISIISGKKKKNHMVRDLLNSIIKYLGVVVGIFLILNAWGVDTPTLLAGAGIIALAVSFGAQGLIEDIISGLFIIFEKQFLVGDVIEINGFRGTVISMGIRITKIEDIRGDIKLINNSEIRGAVNTSSHLSFAVCEVSISYDEDIKKVEDILNKELPKVKDNIKEIAEGPFYRGVQALSDSSVVLQVYAKTKEINRLQVQRELNRAVKIIFDENNIKIPFPQLVIHTENDKK